MISKSDTAKEVVKKAPTAVKVEDTGKDKKTEKKDEKKDKAPGKKEEGKKDENNHDGCKAH